MSPSIPRRLPRPLPRLVLGGLCLAALCACETVPRAQVDEAHALERDEWRIEASLVDDDPGLSVSRGVAPHADAGAQIESDGFAIASVWGKYSHRDRREGLAVATIGGLFSALSGDTYRGVFVGPILSYRHGHVLASLRARYNRLDHGGSESTGDEPPPRAPHENVGQLDLSLRLVLPDSPLSVKVGIGCYRSYGADINGVSGYDSADCGLALALTWFR